MAIKKYPTLYSRDSHGKIRLWSQEQDGEKYRTVAGIKGSDNLVTADWTIAIGKNTGKKNATSGEKQCELEIAAKYKKQLKTGYFESEKDVDQFQYIEPILAKSYGDYADEVNLESGEYGAQTKFNGICMIASKHGLFSRRGEKFISVPHIEEALAPFFVKYPDSFLHGEIFNDTMRQSLNEIMRLCRKTKDVSEEDLKKSKELISFYIYDGSIPEVDLGDDSAYILRKNWIDKNVIGHFDFCMKVETTILKNKEQLDSLFGAAIERGDEGLIIRKMSMPYEHKRSKNLLKYKPLDDSDAIITAIHEGEGNWSGAAAKASVKWKDKTFDATFKGSYEERQIILKEKDKWIGKKVEFLYNGLTGYGIPNYARIDVNNCFKE
jgi:DNA ligase-1